MPLYHAEPTSDDEDEKNVPIYKRKPPKPVTLSEMEEFLKRPPMPPPSMPQDVTLWMPDRHLADPHIRILAEHVDRGVFDYVKTLQIANNEIGSHGMGYLAVSISHGHMTQLTHCNISRNPLGAEGGRAFASMMHALPRLRQLELNYCQLYDEGAKAIFVEATKGNMPSVDYLYLKGNLFADGAMEALCDAFASGNVPKLIHLLLGENEFGDEGMLCLANAIEAGHLATCRHIDLGPAPKVGVDGKEVVDNVCAEYQVKPLKVMFQ